ncbi:BLOC-2 complex member HPS6 [Pholidichthys leucotaenia]
MAQMKLEQLSDFGDYFGSKELSELLALTEKEHSGSPLSDVRLSPDERHIHVILHSPQVGLVTFDKFERPQLVQNRKELCLTRAVPVVDVLYLNHHAKSSSAAAAAAVVAAVIYEDGKAEFWKFQECSAGWRLLQTSDLCNSPRARVVSACACANLISWCEERPASESSPALSSARNKFRYCVCRRDFEVGEGAVSLGGVKIALHSNPKFIVISSGECVHLLPDFKAKPLLNISKFFLSWFPRRDSFIVSCTCRNVPLKKFSAKECDFKKLVTDCLGYLSALEPPGIYSFSPVPRGGLTLLLSTGWLCLLQKDMVLRQVYKLPDGCLINHSTHTSLCVYEDALALVLGHNLHLIDLNCGKELGTIVLKREGLLYVNHAAKHAPHLLSGAGLFSVANSQTDTSDCDFMTEPSGCSTVESIHPGALLVEAVFEEACKYYQQRSLSSTQLTVDALKKGGRFQAPISLASILWSCLSTGVQQKRAEPSKNGGDGCVLGLDKLMGSLESELKALVSLEEVKGILVTGSVKEVEAVCESLIEKEVARVLSSSELDKEALLYLNSVFSIFPCQAWTAVQTALQLHYNGEGSLTSRAPPDMWKSVLSPAAGSSYTTALPCTNGSSKYSLKGDYATNCKAQSTRPTSPAVLPVFELLCQSVFHFQPTWLPRFLELAQQQQGSVGLGLNLASSSWRFSSGRGGEGMENNVPLYKRALCLLSSLNLDRDQHQDLEVELLLVSGRPNAILQALRVLMGKQQWERVAQVAVKFCKQSPLLKKEVFTILLCEMAQHRNLDPYLDLVWELCPEDFTVTTILNSVLKNLPPPSAPSHSSSPPCTSSPAPPPFAGSHSSQLTIGLLKPLLKKVLHRETKPSQRYVDILQSPSFPPPALPRQPNDQSSSVSDPSTDSPPGGASHFLAESPEHQPSTHSAAQRSRVALPAAAQRSEQTCFE